MIVLDLCSGYDLVNVQENDSDKLFMRPLGTFHYLVMLLRPPTFTVALNMRIIILHLGSCDDSLQQTICELYCKIC